MAQSKIKLSKQAFFDDNLDANAKKITNLATPVDSGDAVTKAYADALIGANDALVYKGVIDCSTNPNYPAADAGHLYKVSVAGKIGGVAGVDVYVGDDILCTVDSSASGDQATVGANWNIIHTTNSGNVVGPASSTDNAIARFDGTTGKVLQNSGVTIDDTGSVNIPIGQSYKINGAALNQDNIGDGTTYKQYSDAEKTKLAGIETAADVTDAANVGSSINGATAKASLVDGDKFAIIDSEATNVLKTSLWSVIKSAIKTWLMGLYVCREVPSGTKNGTNTAFTLANTPVSGTEMVFLNGLLQNGGAGNDYTISTVTITFAVAPISTDTILVTYWK
ncbi:MAG: hypothetical protein AB1633_00225 [Elusimicrobiota bacterium]